MEASTALMRGSTALTLGAVELHIFDVETGGLMMVGLMERVPLVCSTGY